MIQAAIIAAFTIVLIVGVLRGDEDDRKDRRGGDGGDGGDWFEWGRRRW